MDDHYPSVISEEERRARRAQRAAARRKKQLERRRRMLRPQENPCGQRSGPASHLYCGFTST